MISLEGCYMTALGGVQMLREGELSMDWDVRVAEGDFSSCPE